MMRVLFFIVLFGFVGLAHSHDNHELLADVPAERANLMKSLASTLKSLSALDFNSENVSQKLTQHADMLVEIADKMFYVFPEGSNEPPSEALDIIWQQPELFEKHLTSLLDSSLAFADNSANINSKAELQTHMMALGKTCGGCHRQFRKKKN